MALLRNIATIGSFTLVSRILGFVRDILIAAILGAGPIADAFFVAFKLPNFFRRLFAEGAFSAAFVPVLSARFSQDGKVAAMDFASAAVSVLFWFLLVLVVLFEIFMPYFMRVLAPGFTDDPQKFDLAVDLSRITFPYLLFIALVSLQGGVLNTLDKFAAMAATPIFLNLCLITALLGFGTMTQTPGHALAWGVSVAGVVQFVWLTLALKRSGVYLRFSWPRLSPDIRRLLKLFLPVALGAGVYQVNLIVDLIIASLLPTGAISFLYFADRVSQLPLGVVGMAVGTALLPLLSRQVRQGDQAQALGSQNRAIEFALLLTLPATAALLTISVPVISVLFERGAFGAYEASATAAALAAFSVGLPAYVLIKVLAPGYFARQNTKTPVKIAVLAMVVNVALNLALMGPLAHVGIALATAISAWLNAGLLAFGLYRRGYLVVDKQLKRRAPRALLCSVLLGLGLGLALPFLEPMLAGGTSLKISALAALVVGGMVFYGALAQVSGAAHFKVLWKSRGHDLG